MGLHVWQEHPAQAASVDLECSGGRCLLDGSAVRLLLLDSQCSTLSAVVRFESHRYARHAVGAVRWPSEACCSCPAVQYWFLERTLPAPMQAPPQRAAAQTHRAGLDTSQAPGLDRGQPLPTMHSTVAVPCRLRPLARSTARLSAAFPADYQPQLWQDTACSEHCIPCL